MQGVKVRESIIRSSVLPNQDKGTVVMKEIIATGGQGGAGQGGIGVGVSTNGIYKEINGGTSVRQSIVRSSVLPTINGGVKILKPIFGGIRKSNVMMEQNENVTIGTTQIAQTEQTGYIQNNGIINTGMEVGTGMSMIGQQNGTINLGTTSINAGTVGQEVITNNTNYNITGQSTNYNIMGQSTNFQGINLGSQIGEINTQYNTGSSVQELGSVNVQNNGLVMGITNDAGDQAKDVGYSTKSNLHNQFGGMTVGNTQIINTNVSPTLQNVTVSQPIVGNTQILKPIINPTPIPQNVNIPNMDNLNIQNNIVPTM